MKRAATTLFGTFAAVCAFGTAEAGVTLDAARVGAEDVPALAKFYESAFGLQEVNRLQMPNAVEIMLNFGDSVEAAKKNRGSQVVIMHRDSDALKDAVPHLIFDVTDMAATVAALKAAGGTMQSEPRAFGNSGITIGIAADPAGNRIELIERSKH